ncbi:RodZ domain-containing protein [Salinisphaera sp. SPP-AMP-43]|uniref:helix-turn-helix domain-containing protein n=1 Tax=Salinisphaera sp. SPP-AMP-43 TaxID=3121288 RepID=UPI003C6DFA14
MNDDETTEDTGASSLTQNKAEGVSPGEILREGRLAHDYSVEDLCAQTKMSVKTVKALEDNDFNALSQPVFARGYYRQCAKVLDIDIDRLMAAYTAWAGEPSAPKMDHRSVGVGTIPQDVTPGGGRFRGLLILLLVIVIVLVAILFLVPSNSMPGLSSSSDEPDQDSQTTTLAMNSSDESANDGSAFLAEQPADTDADSSSGTPDVVGDNGGEPRTGQKAGGRNVNQSLGIDSPNGGSGGDSEAAEDGGQSGGAERGAVPDNRLELSFSHRSWVRVTDANGNRMASGIFESGDTKEFNGEPPYKVTLGYAPGVKVAIGGQAVDVAGQATDGGVAHLTINPPNNNG